MAFDPFLEEKPRPKLTHELGQDLSLLSVSELDERIDGGEHIGKIVLST